MNLIKNDIIINEPKSQSCFFNLSPIIDLAFNSLYKMTDKITTD